MVRKNQRKSSFRRKKINPGVIAFGLIIALGITFGIAYFWFGGFSSTLPPKTDLLNGEPVLTGKDVDYRKVTEDLQEDIQLTLEELGGTIELKTDEHRKSDRTSGGKIDWTFKTWEVKLPEGQSMDEVASALQTKYTQKGKVEVTSIATQPKGVKVIFTRIDELGGESLRLKYGEVLLYSQREKKNVAQGKLAIVIDDFGYRGDLVEEFARYPHPLTFAILPNHPHTTNAARLANSHGKEYILHLPMEAMGNAPEEKQVIRVGDSQSKIDGMLQGGLGQIPGAIGVNNHQGSKATSDQGTMDKVMGTLKKEGLVFLDSRTSGSSVAERTARSLNIPTNSNKLFLDGEADVSYIKSKIREAVAFAKANGTYIVIGHDRPRTLQALQEIEAIFEQEGVEVVPLSELLY